MEIGKLYTVFWWGNLRERTTWKTQACIYKSNIKMDLQEVGCGGMDWIDLSQHRYRWRAVVNVVMNLWVPYSAGNFLTS
jgi:hypothetical protein